MVAGFKKIELAVAAAITGHETEQCLTWINPSAISQCLGDTRGEDVGVCVGLTGELPTGLEMGKANVGDGDGDAAGDPPGDGDCAGGDVDVAPGDGEGLGVGVGVGGGGMIFSQ